MCVRGVIWSPVEEVGIYFLLWSDMGCSECDDGCVECRECDDMCVGFRE